MNYQSLLRCARNSIINALKNMDEREVAPKEYTSKHAGVFVTLRNKDGSLRGCVGTFLPSYENIWEETFYNARKAAFEDPRFDPVTPAQMSDIRLEISVLGKPEKIINSFEYAKKLDPNVYGIIVTASRFKKGLLLPGIEGVNTWQDQIEICLRKGGIDLSEPISIERFRVEKVVEED